MTKIWLFVDISVSCSIRYVTIYVHNCIDVNYSLIFISISLLKTQLVFELRKYVTTKMILHFKIRIGLKQMRIRSLVPTNYSNAEEMKIYSKGNSVHFMVRIVILISTLSVVLCGGGDDTVSPSSSVSSIEIRLSKVRYHCSNITNKSGAKFYIDRIGRISPPCALKSIDL